MNLNTLSILFIASSVLSSFLAFYASKRKNDKTTNALTLLLYAVSIWSLFYGLELASTTLSTIKICLAFEYLGIVSLAVLWFIYASRYSGKDKWLSKANISLLFIVPIIIWIMVISNDFHNLFYASNKLEFNNGFLYIKIKPGIFYWIHIIYSYTFVLLGFIKVFRMVFEVSSDNKLQVIQILISMLIPYVVSIAYILGFKPYGFVDLTPIGFLLMGIFLSFAAFRNKIFEIKPLALNTLFDNIPDAIFVLDNNMRIINSNPKAKLLLKSDFFSNTEMLKKLFIEIHKNNASNHELEIDNINYKVSINEILNDDKGLGTMIVFSDITLQKIIQNALRESEEQHRLIFETAQEGIAVAQDNRLVFFNPLINTISGYETEELMNIDFINLIHADDRQLIAENFKKRLAGEEVDKLYEIRIINKSGKTTWIELSSVRFNWNSKPATLNFVKDISVQKQTSSLQTLLMSISNTYINAPLDSLEEKINNSLQEMGEFVHADRSYIFEYIWDKEICNNTYEWCAEGIEPEIENLQNLPITILNEWVEVHKQNKHLFIKNVQELAHDSELKEVLIAQGIKSLLTIPLIKNGSCVGFVGFDSVKHHYNYTEQERNLLQVFSQMLVNVQNRKESNDLIKDQIATQKLISEISSDFVRANSQNIEAKINSMLEKVGSFYKIDRSYVLKYSEDGKYESNTNEWCAPGIHSEIVSMNNINMEIFPWWKNQIELKQIIHIYNTSELPIEAEREMKEFQRQNIQSIICVPVIKSNRVFGYLGFDSVKSLKVWGEIQIDSLKVIANILGDAIIKVNNEIELIKSKELAEAASVAKSDFLSNMSHEIRTPLNGVIGFTELLRNTTLNKTQIDYLDNAINSANSLLNVISDILDFSKIEAGKLELDYVKTDIVHLVQNSSDIIKLHAANKGLELLLNVQIDTPRFALVDPIRLKQILVNLLSNAVKFTHSGEVELKLAYKNIDAKNAEFTFEVRDTGVGIKESDKDKLFKAFSQADTSTTRRYGGTGLGLIISNSLAHKMGSNINFNSEYGKGSSFKFTIQTTFEDTDPFDNSSLQHIKNVLVIDDNENNRLIITDTFKYWGIHCDGFNSGFTALERINDLKKYDLIIVDYHMPDMDGIETITKIREVADNNALNLPIILLHSSSDDSNIHLAAKSLNIRFMLTKPVKSDELFYYIQNVFDTENVKFKNRQQTSKNKNVENMVFDEEVTILIAEDTKMNMLVIGNMLKNILPNAILLEANNGLEALECLKNKQPDLILMDVQMPQMDGLDATVEIRKLKNHKNTNIIALTAGVSKEERDNCFKAGMTDFLSKPIDKESLHVIIKKYLDLKIEKIIEIQAETDYEESNELISFDKNELMIKIGNNDDIYKQLIDMAIVEFPKSIQIIETAITEKKTDKLLSEAHKLKGSAANMCFIKLTDLALKLEQSVDNNKKTITYLDKLTIEWLKLKSTFL